MSIARQDVDRGNLASSNQYVDHVPLKPDRKTVLMLTDKYVALSKLTGSVDFLCLLECIIPNQA